MSKFLESDNVNGSLSGADASGAQHTLKKL